MAISNQVLPLQSPVMDKPTDGLLPTLFIPPEQYLNSLQRVQVEKVWIGSN